MDTPRRLRRARHRQGEQRGSDKMRLRNASRLGVATLVAVGLLLAGRFSDHLGVGGHFAADGHHLSGSTVSDNTARTSHSDTRLTATVRPGGNSGGVLVLHVPPAAPELCSPKHIAVGVRQTAVVACRSANYGGPIAARVANPAIATVTTSGGLMVPRYLYVKGLKAGTTIVRVSYRGGPTRRYRITVSPAGTSGR